MYNYHSFALDKEEEIRVRVDGGKQYVTCYINLSPETCIVLSQAVSSNIGITDMICILHQLRHKLDVALKEICT